MHGTQEWYPEDVCGFGVFLQHDKLEKFCMSSETLVHYRNSSN